MARNFIMGSTPSSSSKETKTVPQQGTFYTNDSIAIAIRGAYTNVIEATILGRQFREEDDLVHERNSTVEDKIETSLTGIGEIAERKKVIKGKENPTRPLSAYDDDKTHETENTEDNTVFTMNTTLKDIQDIERNVAQQQIKDQHIEVYIPCHIYEETQEFLRKELNEVIEDNKKLEIKSFSLYNESNTVNRTVGLKIFVVCKQDHDDTDFFKRIESILPKPFAAVCLIVLRRDERTSRSANRDEVTKDWWLNLQFGAVVDYDYSLIKGIEDTQNNKQTRNKVEKFLGKGQIQIFCRHSLMDSHPTVQPRLINQIKAHLKKTYTSEFIPYLVDKSEWVFLNEPVIVVCVEIMRMYADVDLAINGLESNMYGQICILYLRHREEHTLDTESILNSSTIENDVFLRKFACVIECVYNQDSNIYNCATNDYAVVRLEKFLETHKRVQTQSEKSPLKSPSAFCVDEEDAEEELEMGSGASGQIEDTVRGRIKSTGGIDDVPWRSIGDVTLDNRGVVCLKDEIQTFKPHTSVPRMNIAVVGPLQAGKSSFINTIDSAFRGYVDDRASALSGTAATTSVTSKYTKYRISEEDRKPTDAYNHFCLCDTRGIVNMNDNTYGLNSLNFTYLLKGYIKEGYQFDSSPIISQDNEFYEPQPGVQDQMHCICFVLNGNTMQQLPKKAFPTIAQFLQKIQKEQDLRYVILLTHMDMVCPYVHEDPSNMYKSRRVKESLEFVAGRLDISIGNIVPIMNYRDQHATSASINATAFLALRQLLRKAKGVIDTKCQYTA